MVTWRTHEGIPELCPDEGTERCPLKLKTTPQILTSEEQVGEER